MSRVIYAAIVVAVLVGAALIGIMGENDAEAQLTSLPPLMGAVRSAAVDTFEINWPLGHYDVDLSPGTQQISVIVLPEVSAAPYDTVAIASGTSLSKTLFCSGIKVLVPN